MIGRRAVIAGAALTSVAPALATRRAELWTFDSLERIGGLTPRVEGAPQIVDSPLGKVTLFDGVRDRLLLPRHPLARTPRFTFEALFRPDGGAFEQRWFHLESGDGSASTAKDGQRMLFEIRTESDEWWLDTFLLGPGYRAPLIDPIKRWPVGRWHHVAQSYDGRVYRAFVNGVEQARAELAFVPQAPGTASVGMRMNAVSPFKGAVRAAAFTRGTALDSTRYVLKIPR